MCKYLTNILYFAIINVIVPEEPFPDVLRRTTNPRHGSVVGLSSHIEIVLLLVAVLIGLIPESGPHIVFITLYCSGAIPFTVLLANSIVQDGHGAIPLFAENKRDFFLVKGIKAAIAIVIGLTAIIIG